MKATTLLKAATKASGFAKGDVARRAGISFKHFSQVLHGHVPLSLKVALRLEYVLGPDAMVAHRLDLAERLREARRQAREDRRQPQGKVKSRRGH